VRALLDVNVLVALLDRGHLHHGLASAWLQAEGDRGWASCPLTQNGCIRILSQPAYPNRQPAAQVAERLARAATEPHHAFWPDTLSLLDRQHVNWRHVLGPRQVTDVYLLALAVTHGGRFVTLDRAISLDAVPGATPAHLVVIGD